MKELKTFIQSMWTPCSRDARPVRPRCRNPKDIFDKRTKGQNALRTERTHEPCVPTTGWMALLLLLLLCASCTHQDLCFDHNEHAHRTNVMIKPTWMLEWQYDYQNQTNWREYEGWLSEFGMKYEDLLPTLPTGLRMYSYHEDGNTSISNLRTEGEVAYLRPGRHSLLFYNNDTEYIVFDQMHSFATAQATTRTRSRSTYFGNSLTKGEDEEEEYTVNPPDMLFGNYLADFLAEPKPTPDTVRVTLHPLVFSYLVRYEFASGLEYVSSARGALAGMARSVYLNSGQTSTENATVLFDCEVRPFGTQAIVRSFGIPDFPKPNYGVRGDERAYGLNLEVRLKNGKMLSFDFDVTDQVARQPQGGIIVVKDIEVPKEEGESGGSGFEVEVNGWGEFENIVLPL